MNIKSMLVKFTCISFLIFSLLVFRACELGNTNNSKEKQGSVQFGLGSDSKAITMEDALDRARDVVITIIDSDGNIMYEQEPVPLYNMNQYPISAPLDLPPGNYELTFFIVRDAANVAFLASPLEGSLFASLVNDPLPISFTIIADQVTKVVPEVLSTDGCEPKDFGYVTFSFEIVNVYSFYISVFIYDEALQNFDLTDGELTVTTGSGNVIYTGTLLPVTNHIFINEAAESYVIRVEKDGFVWERTYLFDELITDCEEQCPIIVIIDQDNPQRTLQISGYVRDVMTYNPIGQARVRLGSSEAFTDSQGHFSLTPASVGNGDGIEVTAQGYAPYNKPSSIFNSARIDNVVLHMNPIERSVVINPTIGNLVEIITSTGAGVSLPPLTGITENLRIDITSYDVTSQQLLSVPGNFTSINSDGGEGILISQGMLNVDITGVTSGNNYTLDGQGPFEIRIPITGDMAQADSTIDLWMYDASISKWIETGVANREGDVYVALVDHFTAYNSDIEKVDNSCIGVTIDDPVSVPSDTYQVRLVIPTMGYDQFMYTTGTDLHVQVYNLPQNTDMELHIYKNGATYPMQSFYVTSPGNNDACSDGSPVPINIIG